MEHSSQRHKKRVLVGEDSPEGQKLIAAYLRTLPVEFSVVDNGQALLDVARSKEIDLILVDTSMPVMSGDEAAGILRAEGFSRPIICISASNSDWIDAQREKARFDATLGKPFDRDVFLRTVAGFLGLPYQQSILPAETFEPLQKSFLDQLPGQIAAMQEALRTNNYKELKYLAHKSRVASLFGFSKVAEICARIDQSIQDQQYDGLSSALEELVGWIDARKLPA